MITEQVWIVDDDSSIRWVLEKAFSNANISTASFENANNLLIALDHAQPEVIISDFRMPEIDGMELLNRINAQFWKSNMFGLLINSETRTARRGLRTDSTAANVAFNPRRWQGRR